MDFAGVVGRGEVAPQGTAVVVKFLLRPVLQCCSVCPSWKLGLQPVVHDLSLILWAAQYPFTNSWLPKPASFHSYQLEALTNAELIYRKKLLLVFKRKGNKTNQRKMRQEHKKGTWWYRYKYLMRYKYLKRCLSSLIVEEILFKEEDEHFLFTSDIGKCYKEQ